MSHASQCLLASPSLLRPHRRGPKRGGAQEDGRGLSPQLGPPHGNRAEVHSHLLLISTRPCPPSTESGRRDNRGAEPRGLRSPLPAVGHTLLLRRALWAQQGAASSLILSLAPLLLSHSAMSPYFSLSSNAYFFVHKKHHLDRPALNTFGYPYFHI